MLSIEALKCTFVEPEVLNERRETVREIVERDREAFEKWLKRERYPLRLDMKGEALRYVLIPERILELAEDPGKVGIRPMFKEGSCSLGALIMERREEAISDPEAFCEYTNLTFEQRERLKERRKERDLSEDIVLSSGKVDKFHAVSLSAISRGELDLFDFVIYQVVLSSLTSRLHVWHYEDRADLRGKGVATSFYRRLHEVARKMGFRFITGCNSDKNVKFFTNHLGRYPAEQINKKYWGRVGFDLLSDAPDLFTVDFLREEDKREFLRPAF